MDTGYSSRGRHWDDRRSIEAMEVVSTLTDDEEDALEAIRRQLDMEFPHWSGPAEWESNEDITPETRTPYRGRAGIVGGALLLAFTAGGGAGILLTVTVLDPKDTVPPALDREPLLPPVTVTRTPSPATRAPAPTRTRVHSRPDTSVERPADPKTMSTPAPAVAASAAPGPARVPEAVSITPPRAPLSRVEGGAASVPHASAPPESP